jgi:outer membrane protein TolC
MKKSAFTLGLLFATAAAAQDPLALTLQDALERARAASPRLARLDALRRSAAADERHARAAQRPDLDVSGSYTRLSDVPELSIPQPDGTQRVIFPNIPDNYAARLSFAVPLYAGGRLSAAAGAAGQRHEAARLDVEAGVRDLELEVTHAYWNLVVADESRNVLAAAIDSFDAHLEDARNRRRFGVAAASDVLAVEVERDRAELRRLEAERARGVAEADLERLLDLPASTAVVPAEDPADAGDALGELDALVTRALERRPELAALQARVAAAEAAVAVESAARKPQVRAAAGIDMAQPNRRILPPEDELEDSWDVSVSVTYNLFDGGKRAAAVARAGAQAEAARQSLVELERAVRLEVTARRLEVETARAGIAVAEKAVLSADENQRVTGERYREGLVPSSERLDAATARLRAGLDLTRARVALRQALAGLERAVGAPWP